MGTGHVHKAADTTTMEGPNGRRISIAGPTAGEEVGTSSGAGTGHEYSNDTTGESRFNTIPNAASSGNDPDVRHEPDVGRAYNGQGRTTGTYHDATTFENN